MLLAIIGAYGFFVGVDTSRVPSNVPLRFSTKTATEFAQVLVEYGLLEPNKTLILSNKEATVSRVEASLAMMASLASADSEPLIVFVASHGGNDGTFTLYDGYFLADRINPIVSMNARGSLPVLVYFQHTCNAAASLRWIAQASFPAVGIGTSSDGENDYDTPEFMNLIRRYFSSDPSPTLIELAEMMERDYTLQNRHPVIIVSPHADELTSKPMNYWLNPPSPPPSDTGYVIAFNQESEDPGMPDTPETYPEPQPPSVDTIVPPEPHQPYPDGDEPYFYGSVQDTSEWVLPPHPHPGEEDADGQAINFWLLSGIIALGITSLVGLLAGIMEALLGISSDASPE